MTVRRSFYPLKLDFLVSPKGTSTVHNSYEPRNDTGDGVWQYTTSLAFKVVMVRAQWHVVSATLRQLFESRAVTVRGRGLANIDGLVFTGTTNWNAAHIKEIVRSVSLSTRTTEQQHLFFFVVGYSSTFAIPQNIASLSCRMKTYHANYLGSTIEHSTHSRCPHTQTLVELLVCEYESVQWSVWERVSITPSHRELVYRSLLLVHVHSPGSYFLYRVSQ